MNKIEKFKCSISVRFSLLINDDDDDDLIFFPKKKNRKKFKSIHDSCKSGLSLTKKKIVSVEWCVNVRHVQPMYTF